MSLATADNAEMPISNLSLLLLLVLLLANIYLAHGQLFPPTCTNLAKSTFQTCKSAVEFVYTSLIQHDCAVAALKEGMVATPDIYCVLSACATCCQHLLSVAEYLGICKVLRMQALFAHDCDAGAQLTMLQAILRASETRSLCCK